MKNIHFLFVLSLFLYSSIFAQQFNQIAAVSEKGYAVFFYKVIGNDNNSLKKLLVYYGNKDNEEYVVYDKDGKLISRYNIGEKITTSGNHFFFKNKLYILGKKLYILDLASLKFTSTNYNFPAENYKILEISENEPDDLLLAGTESNVDVYNFRTFEKLLTIHREVTQKYARPSVQADGMVVFLNKQNELAGFSIKDKKIIWKLNAGTAKITMLGISLGSYNDPLGHYVIYKDKNNYYLYSCTGGGHLYKQDLLTGKVLLEKKSFKGTGNNAGMLTSLYLEDMNKDGVLDLVGAAVDDNMYCLNGKDFSEIWEYDTDNEHQMPLALYDINGDGIKDVFGVNDYDNILSIVDGRTGKLIKNINVKEGKSFFQTFPVVEDFNEPGYINMMVKTASGSLRIYKIKLAGKS